MTAAHRLTAVHKRLALASLVLAGVVAVALTASVAAKAAALPGEGFLPDGRVWELVSPPDKNGGDIAASTVRTRVASDGDAVGFSSLAGFSDVNGMGIAADYLAKRTDEGWRTHGLTPRGPSMAYSPLINTSLLAPSYMGHFSDDLDVGVFRSWATLSPDPSIDQARSHLYVRDDLLTPGAGNYQLVSACPRCASLSAPLAAPASSPAALQAQPLFAASSPDLSHIAFETRRLLTEDSIGAGPRLYEMSGGEVRLVGRIPAGADIECDDAGAPACVPVDVSVAGQGAGLNHTPTSTPHAVSDGSDGHTRIFFTRPTNAGGTGTQAGSFDGNLYMRVDAHQTVLLNASERTDCAGDPTCGGDGTPDPSPAAFARAKFLDASDAGIRSFFSTSQPLTDDAPDNGQAKLYLYDATKPASAPDNLTLVNRDGEPDDVGAFVGVMGLSDDGSRVYFMQDDQLVDGEPLGSDDVKSIFLWEDGVIDFVAPFTLAAGGLAQVSENVTSGPNSNLVRRHSYVTPDGGHLLFSAFSGEGLTEYDHGSTCTTNSVTVGACREFYVYSVDTDEMQCVSCNPSGAPATHDAIVWARLTQGAAINSVPDQRVLSDDGRFVFFSTPERLVPEDVNGPCALGGASRVAECADAYVYDTVERRPSLLSSGKGQDPAVFLSTSADGQDAFIATTEQLSGWDVDGSYDIYDARVDGGLPEPEPDRSPCQGNDGCRGVSSAQPVASGLGSLTNVGEGNPAQIKPKSCTSARRRLTRANRVLKRAGTKVRKRNARRAVRRARRQLATCKRGDA